MCLLYSIKLFIISRYFELYRFWCFATFEHDHFFWQAVADEIEESVKKYGLYPRHLRHVKCNILSLRKKYENALKNYKAGSDVQKPSVLNFSVNLNKKFNCTMDRPQSEWTPNIADHSDESMEEEDCDKWLAEIGIVQSWIGSGKKCEINQHFHRATYRTNFQIAQFFSGAR